MKWTQKKRNEILLLICYKNDSIEPKKKKKYVIW